MYDTPVTGGTMHEEKMGKYDKWEVEEALRTILEADKISKDKALMKEVMKCAKEQDEALETTGLINKSRNKSKKKSHNPGSHNAQTPNMAGGY